MTATRDPDRLIRAWLDLMPNEAPDRVIKSVLQATAAAPQARALPWLGPRRSMMMRLSIAALAAASAVAIGGLWYANRPDSNIGPPPSPSPTLPASLSEEWVGTPRSVPVLGETSTLRLTIDSQGARVSGNTIGENRLASEIRATGSDSMELVSLASDGCSEGDAGRYGLELAPLGSRLRLTAVSDACAARAAAFAGDWYRIACRNPTGACYGDVDAGTYPSQYFAPRVPLDQVAGEEFGAVRFTVPDGWAVADDFNTNLRLTRSALYAQEGSGIPEVWESIEAWIRPAATVQDASCGAVPDEQVERTPDALVDWLIGLPSLEAGGGEDITIDGHPGHSVEVRLADTWTESCPGFAPVPAVVLFGEALGPNGPVGDDPFAIGLYGEQRSRFIVLDLGADSLALIVITASDEARFDSLLPDAIPIVESFDFE
jgi:hypothetical protein